MCSDRVAKPRNFHLLGGKQYGFYYTERDECQHQYDEEEHDAAVFEARPANDLDAIEQPVGCQVEHGGNQRVVDDFQDFPPVIVQACPLYDAVRLCRE
jgi:hypothetical protein